MYLIIIIIALLLIVGIISYFIIFKKKQRIGVITEPAIQNVPIEVKIENLVDNDKFNVIMNYIITKRKAQKRNPLPNDLLILIKSALNTLLLAEKNKLINPVIKNEELYYDKDKVNKILKEANELRSEMDFPLFELYTGYKLYKG